MLWESMDGQCKMNETEYFTFLKGILISDDHLREPRRFLIFTTEKFSGS